MPNYRNRMN